MNKMSLIHIMFSMFVLACTHTGVETNVDKTQAHTCPKCNHEMKAKCEGDCSGEQVQCKKKEKKCACGKSSCKKCENKSK